MKFSRNIFTAHVRSTTGRYCFHRCLSVHTGGGGLPYLHPIILPLVPCPFHGVNPVMGYPLTRDGVPPSQVIMEVPLGMGQQKEYASCLHAGGLSNLNTFSDKCRSKCYVKNFKTFEVICVILMHIFLIISGLTFTYQVLPFCLEGSQ